MARGRKRKVDLLNGETIIDNSIGPVDVHVGSRIAARRKLLQVSQKDLADRLGITFQQVQKYEKGVNRIGAGRLFSIAMLLGVDVSYFYSDMPSDIFASLPEYDPARGMGFFQNGRIVKLCDPMQSTEATIFLKAYYSLPLKCRHALFEMLTSLHGKDEDE